jgi:hypothetical protein
MTKSTSQLFAMLNRAGVGAKLQARYVPNRNPVLHIEIIGSHESDATDGCSEQGASSKAPAEVTVQGSKLRIQPLSSLTCWNSKSAGRAKRCSRSKPHVAFGRSHKRLPDFLSKHSLPRKIRGQSAIIPHRVPSSAISRCIARRRGGLPAGATVNQSSMSTA